MGFDFKPIALFALEFLLSSYGFWAEELQIGGNFDRDVSYSSSSCHHVSGQKSSVNITFITYSTPNIEHYAHHVLLINDHYVYRHQQTLLRKSPETGDDFDTIDQRWNKVKILYNEIKLRINDPGDHYLVWLDADLIIVNHSFRFANIIEQHYKSDIIISREVDPANGIANSGCFIVKVSSWSLNFLDAWWSAWDHTSGMDQHVFDYLYHTLSNTTDHIALLSYTALNSRFPGLINHHDEDPILHLAGESNFIRQHIFEIAWTGINDPNHYLNSHPEWVLPPFGLSRNVLDSVNYTALHEQEWNRILQQIHIVNSAQEWDAAALQAIQYDIREAQQSLSKFLCTYESGQQPQIVDTHQAGCLNLKEIFYNQAVEALQFVYNRFMYLLSLQKGPSLPLLQSSIDAAFELLTILQYENEFYLHIAIQSMDYLHAMKVIVATQPLQLRIILYYHFKLLEFTALYHVHHNNLQESVNAYEDALSIWRTMVEDYDYYGSGNGIMNSHAEGIAILKQLIALLCSSDSLAKDLDKRTYELMLLLEDFVIKDGLMPDEDVDMSTLQAICMKKTLVEAERQEDRIKTSKKKFRRKHK